VDTLQQGTSLQVNQFLTDAAGAYKAAFDNTGNLVVIKTATNTQLYTSKTGSPNPGRAELQVGHQAANLKGHCAGSNVHIQVAVLAVQHTMLP
jgi:hypothetical protein